MEKFIKCFKCKKVIEADNKSIISFYAINHSDKNESEYNFCSEPCLDGFFKDRIKFKKIVKGLQDEEDNKND